MKWTEITEEFIGTPYKFGGWTPGKELDCLAFICLIQEAQGHEVDYYQDMNGYYLEDYTDIKDHGMLNKMMVEFIYRNTRRIQPIEYRPGVIVIAKDHNTIYPSVLDGSGKIITCTQKHGVIVLSGLKFGDVRKWGNK